jgi:glycerol kinase
VEHDPIEIWRRTQKIIGKTLQKSKIKTKEIAALGVTNQRETTVVWDPKTGVPFYNAIVWQCIRTKEICEDLMRKGLEPFIVEKTGLRPYSYFSGPKIKWILENVQGLKKKAKDGRAIFGTIDTWLIWNLTGGVNGGVHITDFSNASRTMLMDLRNLEWDSELVYELKIPSQMLPKIEPSSKKDAYGFTCKAGIFKEEIPVCGDIGDQQAALVGQSCFKEGESKNTYGTGCFMLMNTGRTLVKSKHGLLTTCAYGFEKKNCVYALEGSVAIGGAVIQWLRDNMRMINYASETEAIAKSISKEGSSGVYFVPAFSGLFTPYWDMKARGCIVGITRHTNREHFIHAALEAICFQTKDVLTAMSKDFNMNLKELKVDGGASVNNYLMQLQSDILGIRVLRSAFTETTSLGSAYVAGLAVGFWENIEEIRKNWEKDTIFSPTWSIKKRNKLYKGWRRAVKRSLQWITD